MSERRLVELYDAATVDVEVERLASLLSRCTCELDDYRKWLSRERLHAPAKKVQGLISEIDAALDAGAAPDGNLYGAPSDEGASPSGVASATRECPKCHRPTLWPGDHGCYQATDAPP